MQFHYIYIIYIIIGENNDHTYTYTHSGASAMEVFMLFTLKGPRLIYDNDAPISIILHIINNFFPVFLQFFNN